MNSLEKARQSALKLFESTGRWIEWKHIPMGIVHCPVCLSLDKCWFVGVQTKMPRLPQHEKCHCTAIKIVDPVARKTANATCPLAKFTDYIFSDKYAWNGKRALFEGLGFSIMDSEKLKTEFEKQAQEKYALGDYILGKLDAQGQRIDIQIVIERDGQASVQFIAGWMVRPHGSITNNTPLGDR